MTTPVKLKIDLSSGMIELEADPASLDDVFRQVHAVLPLLGTRERAHEESGDEDASAPADHAAEQRDNGNGKRAPKKPTNRTKETYRLINLDLKEDERAELRRFYAEKSPSTQNEQTAVLMDWLKRKKNRVTLNKDAIFTAFRTVDAKAPGKISSVLGNMAGAAVGWVVNRGDGTYELTHVAEDFVRLNLPPKKAK